MRRPPRFARIVANYRAFLMAAERFDRGIDIENPRLVEQWPNAIIEMPLQPLHARAFVDLSQRPPQRILTDHFAHPEQRRVDGIAAQCRDVGIAPVPWCPTRYGHDRQMYPQLPTTPPPQVAHPQGEASARSDLFP